MKKILKTDILLEQLLNSPNILIMVSDSNRKIVFANDYFCRMFMYDKEELIGKSTRILYKTQRDYDEFSQEVLFHAKAGKHLSLQRKFVNKNGGDIWCLISSDLIENNGHILWTAIDIKIQKENEFKLIKLHRRMKIAMEANNAGTWEINLKTGKAYYSEEWQKIFDYTEETIKNDISSWTDILNPKDLFNTFKSYQKVIKNRETYFENTHRLKSLDGKYRWILARAIISYDSDGTAVTMTGVHTDITEQKNEELHSQHRARIIEQIHESVISMDLNGIIRTWNHGSSLISGYYEDEAVEKHITTFFVKEDVELLMQTLTQLPLHKESSIEVRLMKKDETEAYVNTSFSFLKDKYDKPIGIIGYLQDITERKDIESRLSYKAHHDALTQLPNRELFQDRLNQAIEQSKRTTQNMALFFIDLDYFKEINDSLGHDLGDIVLIEVAKRLKSLVRKNDTVSRLGGDEFVIILTDLVRSQDAAILAEKILHSISKPFILNNEEHFISSSIGISIFPFDGVDAKSITKNADIAMYRAKNEGRDNYQFFSEELSAIAFERISMSAALKNAIIEDEFIVYFQPQVDANTNKLLGVEALIRWKHPTMGLISPNKFIPLAESIGLMEELDMITLKKSMHCIKKWKNEALDIGFVSVNLSKTILKNKNFLHTLETLIDEIGIEKEWIEFEVTESQLLENKKRCKETLNGIHRLGVSLVIDDFGTGHSSLTYLETLPISKIKIDRSFTKGLPKASNHVKIAKVIMVLAKSLDLKVVAAGVEKEEQKDFFVYNGCFYIQGNYYSPAISEEEMHTFLKEMK